MNFKEKLENKKILVTGGAGFIGSNLVEKLLELGAVVTVLDNFATGHRHNIEPFFKNEKFTLIEGDIRDLEKDLFTRLVPLLTATLHPYQK